MTSEPPLLAGRYRPLRLLSERLGVRVFLAADRATSDVSVVLKAGFVSPFFASSSMFFDQAARFFGPDAEVCPIRNEAAALSRLDHRQVIPLHEVGDIEGTPFLVVPWLDCPTLASARSDPNWSQDDSLDLARQLLAVLAHVHERGVVHRDLRPQNLLVGRACGRIDLTLIDFDVASLDGRGVPGLVGSTGFVPPELAESRAGLLSPRAWTAGADLFAAGVLLSTLPEPDARLRRVAATLSHARPSARFPSALAALEALEARAASTPAGRSLPPDDELVAFSSENATAPAVEVETTRVDRIVDRLRRGDARATREGARLLAGDVSAAEALAVGRAALGQGALALAVQACLVCLDEATSEAAPLLAQVAGTCALVSARDHSGDAARLGMIACAHLGMEPTWIAGSARSDGSRAFRQARELCLRWLESSNGGSDARALLHGRVAAVEAGDLALAADLAGRLADSGFLVPPLMWREVGAAVPLDHEEPLTPAVNTGLALVTAGRRRAAASLAARGDLAAHDAARILLLAGDAPAALARLDRTKQAGEAWSLATALLRVWCALAAGATRRAGDELQAALEARGPGVAVAWGAWARALADAERLAESAAATGLLLGVNRAAGISASN